MTDKPRTYDEETILKLKARIVELEDRYNKHIAMDTQLEAENANAQLYADECRELRVENIKLKTENAKLKNELEQAHNQVESVENDNLNLISRELQDRVSYYMDENAKLARALAKACEAVME